jgi:hypothetical protein
MFKMKVSKVKIVMVNKKVKKEHLLKLLVKSQLLNQNQHWKSLRQRYLNMN